MSFGGVSGQVVFKGLVYAGVLQLNVRVPAGAPSGPFVPMVLSVNGVSSPGATLALR